MRDEKDPGTLEMLPAKRGRPALNPDFGPMTPAEKQRRYRNRVRSRAGMAASQVARRKKMDDLNWLADYSDVQLLEAVRSKLSDIRQLGDTEGRQKSVGALVGELARRYPQK